jgi:hypothetical protein
MGTVHGPTMGGLLDAPSAPWPTLKLDTDMGVMDAHPKKGCGAKRTTPYAG